MTALCMTDRTRYRANTPRASAPCESGIVLPMALILLVIISLAGLLAARNAATHEQFSNNMRTTQVARQSAEAALRYCESVAIDIAMNDGAAYPKLKTKLVSTALKSEAIAGGEWNTKAAWAANAINLITYEPDFDNAVQGNAKVKAGNYPTCLIQAMTDDRILVTARGLSNDASLNANNQLEQGAEIWLQSVLSPDIPMAPGS